MAYLSGTGVGAFWSGMKKYFKEQADKYPRFLPAPMVSITYGSKNQSAVIKLRHDFSGYGNVTVRYKAGSDPTESDAVFDMANGLTVTSSGNYYLRAFPVGESIYKASPSFIARFTKATLSKLPTPSISVSRVSSSQGRVTISNYSSYPSGTRIYINGTSYALSSSISISIGTSATTVTVYARYDGSALYESQSSSTSGTIPAYVAPQCASPSISFSSSSNRVTITCSTSGATIYYRRGSSGAYSVYSGSFTISSTTTIYAYATRSGYRQSNTVSKTCTYTAPKCATPSISQSGNVVSFSCSTSGATIHYSGCGVSGTCSSGGSVTIKSSGTMTAYATASGYSQSSTASKSCTYTMPQIPDFNVSSANVHTNGGYVMSGYVYIKGSNIPEGTIFRHEFIYNGDIFYTVSQTGTGESPYLSYANYQEGYKIPLDGGLDIIDRITASCDGYASRTKEFSIHVYDTKD